MGSKLLSSVSGSRTPHMVEPIGHLFPFRTRNTGSGLRSAVGRARKETDTAREASRLSVFARLHAFEVAIQSRSRPIWRESAGGVS
jgi:hypothetical protein